MDMRQSLVRSAAAAPVNVGSPPLGPVDEVHISDAVRHPRQTNAHPVPSPPRRMRAHSPPAPTIVGATGPRQPVDIRCAARGSGAGAGSEVNHPCAAPRPRPGYFTGRVLRNARSVDPAPTCVWTARGSAIRTESIRHSLTDDLCATAKSQCCSRASGAADIEETGKRVAFVTVAPGERTARKATAPPVLEARPETRKGSEEYGLVAGNNPGSGCRVAGCA